MRHLMGVLMFAGAILLAWSAWNRRDRGRFAARAGMVARPLHPSLATMAEVGPPLVITGLVIAAVQVVFAFWMTDGAGVFSLFDLAGFLVLLVAYGTWVRMKARYRLIGPR